MYNCYDNSYKNMTQYIVKQNDSLYKIAKLFNTTVEDLKKVNHLISNTIYPNQILFIPNNSTCNTNNTYVTNNGDSLKDIINKFGLNLEDLNEYNDLDKLKLEGNQLLLVEKRKQNNMYECGYNEHIEDILSKYNLSPLEFLKLNENNILKNGNQIIISQ